MQSVFALRFNLSEKQCVWKGLSGEEGQSRCLATETWGAPLAELGLLEE